MSSEKPRWYLAGKEAAQVLHFQPFDPVHKRTEATVKGADESSSTSPVSLQVILKMSTNAGEVKDDIEKAVNAFAAKGYRSLGVTRADEENQWRMVGVLPLFDELVRHALAYQRIVCWACPIKVE